ncbi:hypothetical protein T484DRAFT_2912558 [Baffinella frigidus]|nr:hypothetical protein T484DRAFT_2912558 [Cryptophyta sp. CCMP2293]
MLRCDCYFDRSCKRSIKPRPPDIHASTEQAGIAGGVAARQPWERLAVEAGTAAGPVVAVCLGATSMKMHFSSLADSPLFTQLLPSIRRTSLPGYEVWVYVGYDRGDLFYDDETNLAAIRKWFARNVAAPLERERKVRARLALVQCVNVLRKPGPVFNLVTAAAAADGAEYLFRVNDDTELLTSGWAGIMVDQLKAFSPANLGVVGPRGSHDASSTRMMLTHDFVHRTHLRIFGVYYPPILSDWWMDDWISHVYPSGHARKLINCEVYHHTEVCSPPLL